VVVVMSWVIAGPGLRVVSLGDGSGVPTFGSEEVKVSATLVLSGLLFGAGAAAGVVLWRRHPRLRPVPAAFGAWFLVGIAAAFAAYLAPVLASALQSTLHAHGTIGESQAEQVIDLAPRLTRQVMSGGAGAQLLELVASAAWAVGGAVGTWAVASSLSFDDDLR